MNKSSIKAVIFDCDGVLVDSEVIGMGGCIAALNGYGLYYAHDTFVRRFVGMDDRAFFRDLREDFRAHHGANAPDEFEDRILEGRRRNSHLMEQVPGAESALTAARALCGVFAIASSSRTEFLHKKLKRTNLYDRAAPHIYSADLVAKGKPAPDIFLYAADRIERRPESCLVLEDSENGVRAARAAGMHVWGFTGGGHCPPDHSDRLLAAGAHTIAEDFDAFKMLLKTLV